MKKKRELKVTIIKQRKMKRQVHEWDEKEINKSRNGDKSEGLLRRIKIKLTPRSGISRVPLQRDPPTQRFSKGNRPSFAYHPLSLSLKASTTASRPSSSDFPPLPRFSELYSRLGSKRRYFHTNSNPSNDLLTSFQK